MRKEKGSYGGGDGSEALSIRKKSRDSKKRRGVVTKGNAAIFQGEGERGGPVVRKN